MNSHSEGGGVMNAKALDKKKRILAAAVECFAQKGFHKSKIIDIAKIANVADGTVYLYFKNKDDLLINVFEDAIGDRLQKIQEIGENSNSALDKLISFFDSSVELFTNNPFIARLMAVELRQSPEFSKKYPTYKPLQKYLRFLQEIIEEAIEEKSIRPVDSKAVSFLIMGTMNFMMTEWALKNQSYSLSEMKDKISDIVMHGLIIRG